MYYHVKIFLNSGQEFSEFDIKNIEEIKLNYLVPILLEESFDFKGNNIDPRKITKYIISESLDTSDECRNISYRNQTSPFAMGMTTEECIFDSSDFSNDITSRIKQEVNIEVNPLIDLRYKYCNLAINLIEKEFERRVMNLKIIILIFLVFVLIIYYYLYMILDWTVFDSILSIIPFILSILGIIYFIISEKTLNPVTIFDRKKKNILNRVYKELESTHEECNFIKNWLGQKENA